MIAVRPAPRRVVYDRRAIFARYPRRPGLPRIFAILRTAAARLRRAFLR